ncbi:IS1595 family transposase, partial [Massilia sp. CFBP9026]|uniref:IS1595 family transposase n=1 Tax=Massilia sp. CFBP9026 TaxID=3096536 RepID=UPI002A69C8E4
MKAPKFEELFAQLALLNQPQRQQVLAALHPAAGLDRVVALIDEIRSKGRCCPDCGCEHCHRHGQANDLQRYRCCACGRTFNDLTGTPLARLRHKGKWLEYLETVLDSRTVRSAAKRVGVHHNTTFRWRHRFLDRVKDDRPERLIGIVEADETFLLESQKGSRKLDRPPRKRGGRAALRGISHHLDCILVARDRSGQTIDAITGRGALKVT